MGRNTEPTEEDALNFGAMEAWVTAEYIPQQ